VRLQGLELDQKYQVILAGSDLSQSLTGRALMEEGVEIELEIPFTSEKLRLARATGGASG
jgi:hypothetical protein